MPHKNESAEVKALRLACQRLGWDDFALAKEMGVTHRHIRNLFANEWSSKKARQDVNAVLEKNNQPAVFSEGIGNDGGGA